jgi:hypothetical protein
MDNNILQRISIPKPCHEDWSKMTPDQKGAFCGVCNKSVHDFSIRTPEEIERILLSEEEGKICGRFSSAQINIPKDVEIPLHLLPRNLSPFRAFALAVFLVFGTAMFGITDMHGQGSSGALKGKVCIRIKEPAPEEQTETKTTGDVKVEDKQEHTRMVSGGVKYRPAPEVPVPVVQEQPRSMMKGEVSYVKHAENDTLKQSENPLSHPPAASVTSPDLDTINDSERSTQDVEPLVSTQAMITGQTVITPQNALQPVPEQLIYTWGWTVTSPIADSLPATLGLVAIADPTPLPVNPVDITVAVGSSLIETAIQDAIKPESEQEGHSEKATVPSLDAGRGSLTCFPNPTSGPTTLNYTIARRCDVSADVYNAQGKMVKQLFLIRNHYEGVYQNGIDLSELPNGTYIIQLYAGESRHSTRVLISK